jgi:hypothetical protein
MSDEIQRVIVKTYTTSPTILSGLNTFSVLNGSVDPLTISVNNGTDSVALTSGQTLMLSASTGFVLPDITLSGTAMSAYVITT